MNPSSPDVPGPEVTAGLRRMARTLVGDELAADDLVQDAWVAALEVPRERVQNWGGWLRGVVRRLALQERRRERTRAQHEEQVARADWVESESLLVERLSSARLLVEAVDSLEDPYGAVLRMHYFDELALSEVAQRLERPLATVKTWRVRGIERLREALDRRMRGDRSAWATVLAPLVRRAPGASSSGALVGWAAGIGAVAVVAWLVVMAWSALRGAQQPEPVVARPASIAGSLGDELALSPVVAPVAPEPRELVEQPAIVGAATPVHAISVRVLDPDGRAAVGARVFAMDRERAPLAEATTDAEGRARLEVSRADAFTEPVMLGSAPHVILSARAPGYARSFDLFVDLDHVESAECVLEFPGLGFDLVGRVVDEQGAPVEGALVENDASQRRLERRGPHTLLPLRPDSLTDADGRFELDAIHQDEPNFRVLCEGYVPRRVVAEPEAAGGRVELEVLLTTGCTLRGVVRRPDGRGSAGAVVTLPYLGVFWGTSSSATADEHGRYELSGIPEEGSFVSVVDAAEPALWNGRVLRPDGERELTWDVTLEPRDSIQVELRDEQDRPLGRRILALASLDPDLAWICDGMTDAQGRARFRVVPDLPLELAVYGENFIADGKMELIVPGIAPSAELQVFHIGGEPDPELARLRASLLSIGEPARLFAYHLETKTQHEERFDVQVELSGLQPGEYELFVLFDERGLLPLGPLELAPGDDFDLGPIEPPRGDAVQLSALPADWSGQRQAELVAIYEAGGALMARPVRRIDLGEARALELLPADYRLRLDAARSIREIAFTVWPGEPLELDLARRLADDRAHVEQDPLPQPDPGGR